MTEFHFFIEHIQIAVLPSCPCYRHCIRFAVEVQSRLLLPPNQSQVKRCELPIGDEQSLK